MTKRIKHIRIQNLKFFRDFSLVPKGKNVLVYGENGSGKSSVFWSFYTIYQSYFKDATQEGALKYFDPQSEENLRNAFAKDDEYSGIEVGFGDENDPDDVSCVITDDINGCNAKTEQAPFMRMTVLASDFLTYRSLSSMYDFPNSKVPDLTNLFVREMWPTELAQNPSVMMENIDGTLHTQTETLEWWWNYLNQVVHQLPKSGSKYVKKKTAGFRQYKSIIDAFNQQVKYYVDLINIQVNKKISSYLKLNERVKFIYTDACYENVRLSAEVNCSVRMRLPRIELEVQMIHSSLTGGVKKVHKPQSFFNEAKLSKIALATRLSLLDRKKNYYGSGSASIFMDDVLLSLDMSNRLPVIDYILKQYVYHDKYQLFVFTHDKAFYNIMYGRILASPEKDNWMFTHLYHLDETMTDDGIPVCLKLENPNSLNNSYRFICTGDYYAAANSMRRACEAKLLELLPMSIKAVDGHKKEQPTHIIEFAALLQRALKFFAYDSKYVNVLQELDSIRDRVFNPSSHYDEFVPIYKEELISALSYVKELYKMEKTTWIAEEDCKTDMIYIVRISVAEKSAEMQINFLSPLIEYKYNGNSHFSNPKVKLLSGTLTIDSNRSPDPINDLVKRVNKAIFGDDKASYKPIEECLFEDITGKSVML